MSLRWSEAETEALAQLRRLLNDQIAARPQYPDGKEAIDPLSLSALYLTMHFLLQLWVIEGCYDSYEESRITFLRQQKCSLHF